MFELTCETDALADMPDSRPVSLSVILRDAKGVEISWSYGEGHAQPGQSIRTVFMVPVGVATVQPRVLGHGVVGARVRNVRAVRTGNTLPKAGTIADCSFGNGVLRGRVGGAGFEVENTRTGRTWKPAGGSRWTVEELDRRPEADGTVRVDFIQPETLKRWKAIYRVEKDRTTRRARAGWRSSRRRTTRRTSLAASRARAASRFSRRARSSFSGKRDRRGIPTSPARSRTPTSAVPRPHTEWQWAIFAPIYTLLTFPIFH